MPGVKLTSYTVEAGTGWTTSIAASSVALSRVSEAITGQKVNALAFGDDSDLTAELEVALSVYSSVAPDTPLRITYTVDGVGSFAFVGVITRRERKGARCTVQAAGIKRRIQTSKPYSPLFYRRPVATRTTNVSIEDPSDPGYRGGLINWLWWQAGGRPWEKSSTYTNALFYYSCDQALMAPDYTWTSGEDTWQEGLRLARSVGGQIVQRGDSVLAFRQPLAFGDGTAVITLTASDIANLEETVDPEEIRTKWTCAFVPRVARALQEVINDSTPRLLRAGPATTLSIDLEPQWPLKRVQQKSAGQLMDGAINACYLSGQPIAPGAVTHTLDIRAQRITITLTNTTTFPVLIDRIVINGEPVTAGENGSVTVGNGSIEGQVDENYFIQSKSHAERLATLALDVYGTSRAIRSWDGVYNPDLTVGSTVNLTYPAWSLSAAPHVLIAREVTNGRLTRYTAVDVTGLPKSSDYYQVGSTVYSTTKKLSY